MKNLFILSSEYPYGIGDSFLAYELDELVAQFEHIYILPVAAQRDSEARSVPQGVTLLENPRTSDNNRLAATLQILKPFTAREIIAESGGSPSRLLHVLKVAGVFGHRARLLHRKLQSLFVELELNPSDTLLYSYWSMEGAMAAALFRAETPGLKALSRCHGFDTYREIHPYHYLPYRRLIGTLDYILPISEKGLQYVQQHWPPVNAKLHKINLGVPDPDWRVGKPAQVIISCSSLIPLKQVTRIASILAKLSKEHDFEWHHFGDGPDRHAVIAVLEATGFVKATLHGHISTSELFKSYRELQPRMLINLSTSEGIPVSIMEAFAIGVPCVAPDVGGISEIVNRENGHLLSTAPSDEEVQQAITAILKEPAELNFKRREAAVRTWEDRFSAAVNYRKIKGLFQTSAADEV